MVSVEKVVVVVVFTFMVGLGLFVWRGIRLALAGFFSAFPRWPARPPPAPPNAGSRGPASRGPLRPAAAACAPADSSALAPASPHSSSSLQIGQPVRLAFTNLSLSH